jgi:hypothetical protein
MKNLTVSDSGDTQDSHQQTQVEKAKIQRPFVCSLHKGTSGGWIVNGTPLTPILNRNGHAVVGERVRETWPAKLSAKVRMSEINALLLGQHVISTT